jgi:outer membrane lipoprotein carrier protein
MMRYRAIPTCGVVLAFALACSRGAEDTGAGAGAEVEAGRSQETPADSAPPPETAPSAPNAIPTSAAEQPHAAQPPAQSGGTSAARQDSPATPPATAPAQNEAQEDEGARILRAASAAYEPVRSLQADFTLRTSNPVLRSATTSRGTLYQRQPDRILLRFSEPQGDVIVGDGTYFWVYYPSTDAEQVLQAPASQAGSGGVDLKAQFVGDPVTRFRYTLQGEESVGGRTAHVLTLVPRTRADYTQLKVWVDTGDSLVRRFEITEHNGGVRRFDLENLRINPALADDLFRFTPPAGARVVRRD